MLQLRLLFFFLVTFAFGACAPADKREKRTLLPAFYSWKTTYTADSVARSHHATLGARRIYLRFFDVVWDEARGQVLPVSPVRISGSLARDTVVPVIYITNETWPDLPDSAVPSLARRILGKIKGMAEAAAIGFVPEIQLDCDWNESTRKKYFSLLQHTADQLHADGKKLSATIRLHQVKYFEKTGVPPVDRGMLMFYNMGDLSDPATKNSIYDPVTAGKYLVNFDRYPLPLDLALPWFSWAVVTRAGKTAGILDEMDEKTFAALPGAQPIGPRRMRLQRPLRREGHDLLAGDILRLESVSLADTRVAAAQIAPYLREKKLRVVFFDLDNKQWNDETEKELEAVLAELR